jgi:hypothetical protein
MAESPSVHDPLSREGVERLVADCSLLLDYLSRAPDSRLDWCFDETRGRAGGIPPSRIAVPPEQTKTKAQFLEALTDLASQVRQAEPGQFPLDPKEVALLLTSRDFLSAIAWPATVETIRVTQAYCAERQRLRAPLWRRIVVRLHGAGAAGWADGAGDEDRADFYGRRIARRRDRYQFGLVLLVALTVWLSYETLVGQRLILEGQRFAQAWSKHEEAVQKASREAVTLVGTLHHNEPSREPQPGFQRYCDYVLRPMVESGGAGGSGGGGRLLASSGTVFAGGEADRREFFLNFEHQRLCDEKLALRSQAGSLEQAFQRWYKDIIPVVGLLRLPGDLYGDLHTAVCSARLWLTGQWSSSWESSERANQDPGAPPPYRPCVAGPTLRPAVGQGREHLVAPPMNAFHFSAVDTEVVTGGMLAQLLPCLYAMLGALASMFRRLGQRVQAEALSVADHGAMRMTLILGVLAGAVIGLFVGQVPTGESGSTLTLAGLAMLAGYAVDRLFNLFDVLSVRLFGESTTELPRSH